MVCAREYKNVEEPLVHYVCSAKYIVACFGNVSRSPPASAACVIRASCVWRRGPRPGKGRNSRTRRSCSPTTGTGAGALTSTANETTTGGASTSVAAAGYELYQKSLLEVPWPHAEYGEASSDDLSSEWDSDVPEPQLNAKVNT